MIFFLAFTTCSAASEAPLESAGLDCPHPLPKKILAPRYPADALRDGIGGKAIVAAWIDKCGRVVKSEIVKSSGNKLLNAAALEAADNSIFQPVKDAAEPLSRFELPYTFTADAEKSFEKASWPASHKKAYFIQDELPMPFASPEAAFDSVIKQPHRLINKQPVLDMRQLKNKTGEIWLFIADNATYKFKVAARYHRIQADKPTVSVQVLCDPSLNDCSEISGQLLKSGLPPFAKSLNQ